MGFHSGVRHDVHLSVVVIPNKPRLVGPRVGEAFARLAITLCIAKRLHDPSQIRRLSVVPYGAKSHRTLFERREDPMGKSRFEAFSDGVMAIIITIMVL